MPQDEQEETKAPEIGRERASQREPGTESDPAPTPKPAGALPSTFDALGRELLAVRSMAIALVGMCDALMTNYRLLQMQNDTIDALTGRVGAAGSANPLEKIAALAARERDASSIPRTFGDRKSGRSPDENITAANTGD